MKTIRRLSLLAAAFWVAACGKPVPTEQKELIGTWRGPGVTLSIAADGRLEHETKDGRSTTKLSAPIQEYRADGFKAGLPFLAKDFKLEKPPHEEAGVWKMTVNAVELARDR